MTETLLTICIPTYNRVTYLRELLPLLLRELESVNALVPRVSLHVSNNASTDETDAYLRGISCPVLSYHRHPANIGGDRNFLACVERARGTYVWLLGDDELIEPGSLGRILSVLETIRPVLLILENLPAEPRGAPPATVYADYGACLRARGVTQPAFALAHTLISANIFRRDAFDLPYAVTRLPTNYAHMYGLVPALHAGGAVVLLDRVLHVRPQRAQFAQWPRALCLKQGVYLWRLSRLFSVPELRRVSIRLFLNLPVEVLSRCAARVSHRFGRT